MKLLINKGPLFYLTYNFRLFLLLIFSNWNVALANDTDTLPAVALATFFKSKRFMWDAHEYFSGVPELMHKPTIRKIWKLAEKLFAKKSSANFFVSQPVKDAYYNDLHIEGEVLRNVPFYKSPVAKLWPTKEEKKIVLYQGAVNMGRGVDTAILAMHILENYELWIVGEGDVYQEMKLLTEKEQLNKKVKFFGKIPFEQLNEITQKAHLGLSIEDLAAVNYQYALPNKFFDYIQAGVPVLCSPHPETTKIIKKYEIGEILKAHKPETLAHQIVQMIEDEEVWTKYQQNAILAAKEFCWENEEQKLIRTIHQLNAK